MEFSDMKYSSETNLTNGQKNRQGCFVSTPMGFVMLLLTIAIAVGVGIIVHFAGNGRSVVCQCGQADVVPSDPQKLVAACKKQVLDGETSVCKYSSASLIISMIISIILYKQEGRQSMFYLTTHSTHFIYGNMASDIIMVKDHSAGT